VTKRIFSALALVFVFALGQFALVNGNARTVNGTGSMQENPNRQERRDRNQYRRRHRKHRRHWRHGNQRHDDRNKRNDNRPPS